MYALVIVGGYRLKLDALCALDDKLDFEINLW